MKIKNKKTGSEYTSSTLKLYNKGKESDWHYSEENNKELHWFYIEDGWEEVKEEPIDCWHDLRKNPDDVPIDDREVLCCIEEDHYRYYNVTRFVKSLGGYGISSEILAWREIPKFNE